MYCQKFPSLLSLFFSPQFARDNNTFLLLLLCSAVYLTAVSLVSPCNTAMDKKSPSLTDKKRLVYPVCMVTWRDFWRIPHLEKQHLFLLPLSSSSSWHLPWLIINSVLLAAATHTPLSSPSSYSLAVGLTLGEKKCKRGKFSPRKTASCCFKQNQTWAKM